MIFQETAHRQDINMSGLNRQVSGSIAVPWQPRQMDNLDESIIRAYKVIKERFRFHR